ncbi:thiamine ABC transporter substrate-binding protein [Halorussus halophilus]|uniref:thiamine ABC transporter substrate-binding protein n=1 Tax=Halorussus halophilus TaxID=2650975 RepID=UPI0013010E0E|nr:thiamine ABC transporter substrate-binding protein [Halorussus halophilus]
MDRRRFLTVAGSVSGSIVSGCVSSSQSDGASTTTGAKESLEGTLTVATYENFVDAPSSSPSPWIKNAFEKQYPDVTLKWTAPKNAFNHYVQRRQQNAEIDADVYIGLKVPDLVRINQKLSKPLFDPVETSRLSNYDHIKSGYEFTPDDRVLPAFTGYQSFVYNGYEIDAPKTLEALTEPEYQGALTVQNAQTDNTGLYFLLWTIKEMGEDGYRDYWRDLLENDVQILESWGEVYTAFTSGETNIITSFSNDQVYAKRAGQDLTKHQVALPGGHGYTFISGMGKFATSEQSALATAFMDFMLTPTAQGKLAELNVSFPITDHADVPTVFDEYAKKPSEPLRYTYDELDENLDTWQDEWARFVVNH